MTIDVYCVRTSANFFLQKCQINNLSRFKWVNQDGDLWLTHLYNFSVHFILEMCCLNYQTCTYIWWVMLNFGTFKNLLKYCKNMHKCIFKILLIVSIIIDVVVDHLMLRAGCCIFYVQLIAMYTKYSWAPTSHTRHYGTGKYHHCLLWYHA